jgi:membrane associated rhomboid family serine protease
MRGRFDRGGFWQLNPQVVQMMMIWFFLCFFVIPNVANGAHAGGLVFGMLIGFATAKFANFRRGQT